MIVSCPANGPACVVTVATDGTAGYDRTGGVPRASALGYFRNNRQAEDLLDHWNDPSTFQSSLGLSSIKASEVGERKRVLKALLDSAGGNPRNSGIRFRNVRFDDIEIIGERNGFTHAQWKAGPAGTLNIEFDYHLASVLDQEARAAVERAGKAWSYHIADDFGTYSIPEGAIPSRTSAYSTEGLVVLVTFEAEGCGGAKACASLALGDTRARLGRITYTRHVAGLPGNSNRFSSDWNDQMGTTVHELGHILLGVDGFRRHINTTSGTFNGPNAREANGGNTVLFRRYKGEFHINVPAGTPGAIVDYSHPGGCVDSAIAYYAPYCGDDVGIGSDGSWANAPRKLDKAFLVDSGYRVLDDKTASQPEIYGFGA